MCNIQPKLCGYVWSLAELEGYRLPLLLPPFWRFVGRALIGLPDLTEYRWGWPVYGGFCSEWFFIKIKKAAAAKLISKLESASTIQEGAPHRSYTFTMVLLMHDDDFINIIEPALRTCNKRFKKISIICHMFLAFVIAGSLSTYVPMPSSGAGQLYMHTDCIVQ